MCKRGSEIVRGKEEESERQRVRKRGRKLSGKEGGEVVCMWTKGAPEGVEQYKEQVT